MVCSGTDIRMYAQLYTCLVTSGELFVTQSTMTIACTGQLMLYSLQVLTFAVARRLNLYTRAYTKCTLE